MTREHPIRLGAEQTTEFAQIMGRFSLRLRETADD